MVLKALRQADIMVARKTTTMVLIPAVRRVLDIPLIAAGGIATGSVDVGRYGFRG